MSAKKIRVMQVTHDLAIGGLQRVVETLCTTIDRDRFEMAVLCVRERGPIADRLEAANTQVTLLERPRHRPDYFPFARIARVLRAFGTDVVHTHNTEPLIGAGVAGLLTGRPTHIHTDHARSFPDKLRYMVAEHLLSYRTYRFVGVSDHTTEALRRYERIPASRLVTIPNGIDPRPFEAPVDRAAKRAELGIEGNGPVIGLGARLVEQKGLGYLLEALAQLKNEFPDITLVIAGDGPLRQRLEQQGRQLGVSDHLLLTGPRLDMPALLKTFDLYVLPSNYEGLPMALLEAMAAGCPIVATDVGGIPGAVSSEVNGLLVPKRDPGALAQAIARLLHDGALRRRFAHAARALFDKRFSGRAMTARYEALYRRG